MDPSTRPFDESLNRELPQLQSLRIAPIRQPVSSRTLSVPSPLEPNASGVRESNAVPKSSASKSNPSIANVPAPLPTLTECLNAARTKKNDSSVESLLNAEPPPKPILPAFVNLRALERFPYSSFDDDSSHARKRRRLDVQTDSFGDHLQLPIPQAQKEQRPPPFGPFAILNGLNEPPPNAALLPPIEAGSIPHLVNRASKNASGVESSAPVANTDGQNVEKRGGRIEEILDSPLEDKPSGTGRDRQEGQELKGDADRGAHEKGGTGRENGQRHHTQIPDEPISPKTRGRSRKHTRRWTEEETIDLLRGVAKCGIGNWKAILAQPELNFNNRTASNLKDRFRFCCPWAYKTTDPNEATKQLHDTLSQALLKFESNGPGGSAGKTNLHSQAVHSRIEQRSQQGSPVNSSNEPSSGSTSATEVHADSSQATPKSTSTTSSGSKAALESLGVPNPDFAAGSRRRNRHPFTAAEDEALLKGYAVHGFQWALIQKDKSLNLGHRKSTDLRDRFRNKFPDAYRHGGSVSGKMLQGQPQTDANAKVTTTDKQKPRDSGHKRFPSSNKVEHASHLMPRPVNPGPFHHAPPQTLLPGTSANLPAPGVPQIPLDDHTGPVDTPFEDNTLPPMIWDELS